MSASSARPSVDRYEAHLEATTGWLARSFLPEGGSRAYAAIPGFWSRMYPETTGYLVPTLLGLASRRPGSGAALGALARRAGEWLLSIQGPEGAWAGGLHPPAGPRMPSVFNTGQVLLGLCALADHDGDPRWLAAAARAAAWLAAGVDRDGRWPGSDYRATQTPSYSAHVAWPMLEVWRRDGRAEVKEAAERVLAMVLARRRPDGTFDRWGFDDGADAFTHTIAYTLCGLIESSRVLGSWSPYGEAAETALEALRTKAELAGGSLPGSFGAAWTPDASFVCLTGNAQLAILLLLLEERERDLRLVNAAAKLVDRVCASQSLRHPVPSLAGAVAGSSPLWGPYMRFRYPNWAAKYLADALVLLTARLAREA